MFSCAQSNDVAFVNISKIQWRVRGGHKRPVTIRYSFCDRSRQQAICKSAATRETGKSFTRPYFPNLWHMSGPLRICARSVRLRPAAGQNGNHVVWEVKIIICRNLSLTTTWAEAGTSTSSMRFCAWLRQTLKAGMRNTRPRGRVRPSKLFCSCPAKTTAGRTQNLLKLGAFFFFHNNICFY